MLKKTTESKLLAGYIYGDNVTKEYVYLPGSEVDTEEPMLVYEDNGGRRHRNGTSVGNHRKKKPQINHTSCIRKEYDGIIDKAIKKECEKSSIFSHSFFAISPNGKRVFYHSSNVFRYSLNPGPMSSLLRANSTMALR